MPTWLKVVFGALAAIGGGFQLAQGNPTLQLVGAVLVAISSAAGVASTGVGKVAPSTAAQLPASMVKAGVMVQGAIDPLTAKGKIDPLGRP